MKKILHVSCSPRGEAAESLRLATTLIHHLNQLYPQASVVQRVIGGGLPPIDVDYANSQVCDVDVSRVGSMAVSEDLVRELEEADILVISTPMHNFTVPGALKSWIDHVVRVRRTFDVGRAGKIAKLADRPVYVAIASGGRFGEPGRQPDFLTPYLRAVLAIIGLHDLTFFSVQGTVFGDDFLRESRSRAERAIQDLVAS